MGSVDPKERFHRQFQNSVTNIQEHINRLSGTAAVPGERQDAVSLILSSISRLSNEVADAADFVPAYDQRVYSAVVKELSDQVNEAQAKIQPKSRFQFKQRPANGCINKPDSRRLNPDANTGRTVEPSSSRPAEDKDTVSSLPTFNNHSTTTTATSAASTSKNYNTEISRPGADGMGIRKPSFSTARDITLSDHMRVHITLPASASRATSAGTLTNLDRCVVDMSAPTSGGMGAPFASLVLKDIAGSVIVAGHVDGPVHITNVRDSVIVVAARQVRIHECDNAVFYLHCVSRPIVEDCTGVWFAKAPGVYLTDKEKNENNLFDQVDDFKWLKATASPNWSVLPESEAIPESVWKKALAGGPGVVIDDTLRTLGVAKGT